MRTSLVALLSALLLAACDHDSTPGGASSGAGGSSNGSPGSSGSPGSPGSPGSSTRFFLPSGDPITNTSAPTVVTDAQGGVHTLYPAYAGGGAFYSYCAHDCASPQSFPGVHFGTDGTVGNAMLQLDAAGHPRVLLSSYSKVTFASCDGDCTDAASWKVTDLLDHGGKKEVTGHAFALDPQGRPRFLMHTYIAYLGVGQGAPHTELVACDAGCDDPAAWKASLITDQIWERSDLRLDATGKMHLLTAAHVKEADTSTVQIAYLECASDCDRNEGWQPLLIGEAYQNDLEAISLKPSLSLALDSKGGSRAAGLFRNVEGGRNFAYLGCASNCLDPDSWKAVVVSNHDKIGDGVSLALDAHDNPRLAYTIDYNIGLWSCDTGDGCFASPDAWKLTPVEKGSDMKADEIFLYPNCNVGAWFLHTPSLSISATGEPRVGYQARDISGGWSKADPTGPDCVAGTDMTGSRIALLPTLP